MKNSAEIYNDGVCVYLNSSVRPDGAAKMTLLLANLFFVGFLAFLMILMWGEKMPKISYLAIYGFFPLIYIVSLGRSTLWNLFGKENIIVNARGISFYRSYGFFSTQPKLIQYRRLYYNIREVELYRGIPHGIVEFVDHNRMDIPMVIFSSTVYLPMDKLKSFLGQIEFVFTIEHLTETGSDIAHLN